MKKRRAGMLFAAGLAGLLMAGCGASTEETTAVVESTAQAESSETTAEAQQEETSAAETEDGEKVLTIAQGGDISTFDMQNHNNGVTGAVLCNFSNGLVERDDNNDWVCVLAESYEMIDDETWEFKLRDDVTWHNGDPFTAEDVKYTYERAATDETLAENHIFSVIKEVQIIDDYTVRFITDGPYPTMLSLLSKNGSQVMPKKYIEENGLDYYLEHPIGVGPYKFKEWVKDSQVVLERYDDYFGGTPYWDEVVFRSIPEASTRVSELLAGNVDVIVNVPTNEWERIDENEGTEMVLGDGTRIYNVIMKWNTSPTQDLAIREAVDYAIDTESIINSILKGAGTSCYTRIAPGVFGQDESLYNIQKYDQEKAKELVASSGYNGEEIEFLVPTGRYLMDKEVGEVVAAMLQQVGLNVKLNVLEWSAFNSKFNSGDFNGMALIAYGDDFFDASYGMNEYRTENCTPISCYSSPEYDALYLEALNNMDPDSRSQQLIEMQQMIFVDECVQAPFIHLKVPYGVNSRIDFNSRIDELFFVDRIHLK